MKEIVLLSFLSIVMTLGPQEGSVLLCESKDIGKDLFQTQLKYKGKNVQYGEMFFIPNPLGTHSLLLRASL